MPVRFVYRAMRLLCTWRVRLMPAFMICCLQPQSMPSDRFNEPLTSSNGNHVVETLHAKAPHYTVEQGSY
jgi:hypothetical protein